MDSGYVYLKTHANARGLHKIGLTRNPAAREAQLGGDECTVIARVKVQDPEKLERELHEKYEKKRLPQSEWFDLSEDQINEIVNTLRKAHAKEESYIVLPNKSGTSPNKLETKEGKNSETEKRFSLTQAIEAIDEKERKGSISSGTASRMRLEATIRYSRRT